MSLYQIPIPNIPVQTGIVLDSTSTSGYEATLSTYNWTHRVGTGLQNTILVVCVSIFATGSVSSITYNGKSLTIISGATVTNGVYRSEVWYIVNPDTGSNTVTVNLSASLTSIANAQSYSGVDQTLPIDASNKNTGTGNAASGSVLTVTAHDRVIANLVTPTTSGVTSSGGQSPRTLNSGALGSSASDDKGLVDTPASTTLTWNGIGVTDTWGVSLVALTPLLKVIPTGYASWISRSISQPLNVALDINWVLIKPLDPGTYFKAPPAPTGAASWLGKSIYQPTYAPVDINWVIIKPADPGNYFKTPSAPVGFASWASDTISQPFAKKQFIPPYDVNSYVWPASEATYFKAPPAPAGAASWLDDTITQPYILPYNEILYGIQPVNVGTYFKAPPAPTGAASWLDDTVSSPYFTPYDVNKFLYPADTSTYSKTPAAPVGAASWLDKSISQPYILPYNEILFGVQPVNVGTYFKAPPAPTGAASWLDDTIAQPYILPYNETLFGIQPVNVATYFTSPPAPIGTASWLDDTIGQPYILPYNETLYGVQPVNIGTYFKAPPAPTGAASWLDKSISQPTLPLYDANVYVWNPNAGNLRAIVVTALPILPTAIIAQPVFTPLDINQYIIQPVNVSTYSKPPVLIFVSSNTIAQPVNIAAYLIPQVKYPLKALGSTTILFTRMLLGVGL